MKILELNLERGWRGGERQTLWTMQRLRETGVEVGLLAREGELLAERARAEGFTVHECGSGFRALAALARVGRQYDLVHSQTGGALTWAVAARPFHGRPVVATRRVAFPFNSRLTLVKYRLADKVIAISRACAEALIEGGVKNIDLISSAVQPFTPDPARIAAFKREYGLEGKRIVATCAALTIDKDPATLVDAVAHIKTPDTVLVHFGRGPMAEEMAARVKEKGLEDRYKLVGFIRDVEQFYPMMDAFVMSSSIEGLGSSVLDAMLARVPVASTAAGGLRESCAEGRGRLAPIGNPPALAKEIDALLDRSPQALTARQTQIDRAYDWVVANCSVQAMGDAYCDLFARMLAKP